MCKFAQFNLAQLKGVLSLEISIKDLLRIIKKGLGFMVITALIFAIGAFGYSKIFVKKTYTTTVKLYVDTTSTGTGSYNEYSAYNLSTALVNTYIEMLKTNNFYQKISENLDNKYTSKQIGGMLSFYNTSETEVFSVRVTSNSPEVAKLVADSVADVAPGVISTLKDNATLKIADYALKPTAPSSPDVMKYTMVGGVTGVVLAFLYIFIKELLDVKFKYNSDMTSYNDIPILAAIPSFDDEKFSALDYFSREAEELSGN